MSKEFEEIVLKKLDALDKRTKNIENELKITKENVNNLNKNFIKFKDETKQKFIEFDNEINQKFIEFDNKIGQKFTEFNNKINQKFVEFDNEINQKFVEFDNKIDQKFKEFENKINKKFVESENKTNKRLDTLFNAIVKNSEEDTAQKEKATSLNKKVFNHEIRISNLENKVLTA